MLPGDPGQELGLHVLADQAVITAEGDRRRPQRAALPQVQRRQVQPGRPPLGPLMQHRHGVVTQHQAGVAQQRRRLRRVRARSAGPISRSRPSARSRATRSGGSARPASTSRDPARHVIGQHRQRIPALPVLQQVHVVQDQHHRPVIEANAAPEPRHHRAGHRAGRGGQRVEHPLTDRLHRIQRLRHVAEQDLRVVVPLIDRHPGEGPSRRARPTAPAASSSRTRPARPPRRSGADPRRASRSTSDDRADRPGPHRAAAAASRRRGRTGPAVRIVRQAGPLTHVAVLHARTHLSRRSARSMLLRRNYHVKRKWTATCRGHEGGREVSADG